MNKVILTLLLLLPMSNSYSAFSWANACFITNTIAGGGLIEHIVETCMTFSNTLKGSLKAERVTEKNMNRVKRYFKLTKDRRIYNVNLETNQCKWINIEGLDHINDPEKLGQEIQQGMGFEKQGPCKDESGEYQGDLFTYAFGSKMCLLDGVFTLWNESPGGKTTVTGIRVNIDMSKEEITLPVDVNTCVEGPDLTNLMNFGQSGSVSEQGNSQINTSDSSANQQPPPSPEGINDIMKNLGKSLGGLEGLFPKQE